MPPSLELQEFRKGLQETIVLIEGAITVNGGPPAGDMGRLNGLLAKASDVVQAVSKRMNAGRLQGEEDKDMFVILNLARNIGTCAQGALTYDSPEDKAWCLGRLIEIGKAGMPEMPSEKVKAPGKAFPAACPGFTGKEMADAVKRRQGS